MLLLSLGKDNVMKIFFTKPNFDITSIFLGKKIWKDDAVKILIKRPTFLLQRFSSLMSLTLSDFSLLPLGVGVGERGVGWIWLHAVSRLGGRYMH